MRKLATFKSWCIIFLMSAGLLSACGTKKYSVVKRLPGTWQLSEIKIDGFNKDWPSPYPEYDDKAALGYCVSNDKENLYITVETGDLATQLKILRSGLTVWIDRTGKKGAATGINFPIPQQPEQKKDKKIDENELKPTGGHWKESNEQGKLTDRQKHRAEAEESVRRMVAGLQTYSLQGFKNCNLEFPVTMQDSCGIVVKINIDEENELVWEAKVPFKTFYNKKELSKSDKGRPISICFETFGLPKPAESSSAGNRGSGGGFRPSVGFGPMGFTGGRGGMMRGGGGHQNRQQNDSQNEMAQMYKSTKTYKVFGLALYEEKTH